MNKTGLLLRFQNNTANIREQTKITKERIAVFREPMKFE